MSFDDRLRSGERRKSRLDDPCQREKRQPPFSRFEASPAGRLRSLRAALAPNCPRAHPPWSRRSARQRRTRLRRAHSDQSRSRPELLESRRRIAPADLGFNRPGRRRLAPSSRRHWRIGFVPRSEEHTSELQSQFHLVCRLLLEKKKIQNY